jgi:hypothetical protein
MKRSERGQALVLGALSFLVLALMVTLSFNLSHALRAKVSLQQHSDSLAYSMAVMEARALNYYAVTNRAIAASFVAMNTLGAHVAAAGLTCDMMRAGKDNFLAIEKIEWDLCDDNSHCWHAREAGAIARDYAEAAQRYKEKFLALMRGHFSVAGVALDRMVFGLHLSQQRVHQRTREAIQDGESHGLRQLKSYNAPGVTSLPGEVGRINVMEFDCAVDGLDCSGSVPSAPSKVRGWMMTEIVNATRPGWPARRAGLLEGGIPWYLHSGFLTELMQKIPGRSVRHRPFDHWGTAKWVQEMGRIHGGGQEAGNEGLINIAEERGMMSNRWRHLVAESPYNTRFTSHPNDRRAWGFICIFVGKCFMKYRANPNPERDWGQPRVYSYVTQSLRIGDPGKAPWELNASGKVVVTHGEQGDAELILAPGEGTGFSKALVYYHRFDNGDLSGGSVTGAEEGWREPPNLFAPYWRAKLHPFSPEEATRLLRAAGDSDAAQLVNGSQGLTL